MSRRRDYTHRVPLISNLNLNGNVPPRARPRLGEWGPEGVPGTKTKKRRRWLAVGAFLLTMLAVFLLGWYVYYLMTGDPGFGLGRN